MRSDQPTTSAATFSVAVPGTGRQKPSRTGLLLDSAIFLFLALFAILLPHSVKGAQHAWQIAFVLWLTKLAVERRRPYPQPLSAPLLAYITLSGISTALSPDPNLSWDRMKIVCLVLVSIVFAQNLQRLKQVRTLIFLLILSGLAAAGFTAWQYTYGVGVRVAYILPVTQLYQAHVVHDDIIQSIDGHAVHTPAQLERMVMESPPGKWLRILYVRGYPFHKEETVVTREQILHSGFGTHWLQFARGRPFKAQGTLGHYVVFAEMMMQIGCMTWAMLLCIGPRNQGLWLLFMISFLALVAALFLTETRAALAGLAIGCFVSVLTLTGKRARIWASAALLLLVIAATAWIYHTRGPLGLSTRDPGTEFRTMMWEDGLRLIGQHPWFGVGMETIRNHWMEWNIRAFTFFHDESHFHSDLMQIAVERGLPAMAAWLWFVIAYLIFLLRLIRKTRERNRFATGVATGVLASFVAFQTTALVHYDLGIESVAMILFFYFGLAVAMDRMVQDPAALDVQ
ncbi:MAG: O-antigen ligase family protein [Candidatus Korobacteraceae bacterium]